MTSDRRAAVVRWSGEDLVFEASGGGEGRTIVIDGDSKAGPSPTEALLVALAACMAIDVLVILEKSRVRVDGLEVRIEGQRAPDPPRRFTRIRMVYALDGPEAEDEGKIERAIELSRDKYCSVHHTLRPDLDMEITFERA